MKTVNYYMKPFLKITTLLVFAVFLLSGSAFATAIDFGVIAPTAGSINYAGGTSPLVGTGIEVDNVIGLDTPLNSGVDYFPIAGIQSATLNFITGASDGDWSWGGIGSISIVADTGVTLLAGNFGSADVIHTAGTFHIAAASFSDTKDPKLTAFYGLPTFLPNAGSEFFPLMVISSANYAMIRIRPIQLPRTPPGI